MPRDATRPGARVYDATDDVKSPRIRRLVAYWRSKQISDRPPRRADIYPEEIPGLLPYILLVDFTTAPFRVFYRLVGTQVVAYNKRDFTGHFLDELAFPSVSQIAERYRRVMTDAKPVYGAANLRSRIDTWVPFEYALLPLSDDGLTVNKCIAMECYGDVDPEDIAESARLKRGS